MVKKYTVIGHDDNNAGMSWYVIVGAEDPVRAEGVALEKMFLTRPGSYVADFVFEGVCNNLKAV